MQYSQNSITLSQAILELHSSASQPPSSYHASSNSGSQPAPIQTHSPAVNGLFSVRHGTIHEICGAPGSGKTGIALDLTSQCLTAGHRVLWLTTRGRAASLPLGQLHDAKDLPATPQRQGSQKEGQQQPGQRRLNAPERTWRQLGHMSIDGVSQLLVIFTHWWKHNLHISQGTRLVVIDDFGHLMRGVPVRMAARVLVEMKRAAQEYGFAVVVLSRLLAQWSVTGRRMMLVPGLPALNGVLDGRIALCHDGGHGPNRVAARVHTGSGPDQAVLEVVRRVQFAVLADRVVDAVEKRDNDSSDDDLLDAYPSKRVRITNRLNNSSSTKNKTSNAVDSDDDGFSDIDFDDLVEAEKKDEVKKKSLLRISDKSIKPDNSNSSDADAKPKLPLQGFMTSGELMQSMVEQGDLSSSHDDKLNGPTSEDSENGSTSPIRQEEATAHEAHVSLASPVPVASSPANPTTTTGFEDCASASDGKIMADSAKSTATSNVVDIESSPLSGNIGNDLTPIVEVSSPESTATDNALNKTHSPVPLNDSVEPLISNSSITGNGGMNSPPLRSTAIVNVSSQDTEPAVESSNTSTSLPPPPPSFAVDISSPESATSAGSSPTKPLVEVPDSQDFGSDEIKLPDEFVPPNSTNVSSQTL